MNLDDYQPLTEQSEAALTAQLPDEEAKQSLVMGFMHRAVKYLEKVSKGGVGEKELISLCYAALQKAVRNFKPDKGKFFPYSKIYLRSALFSSWKNNRSVVRHADTISESELHFIDSESEEDNETAGHASEGFEFDAIDTRERWSAVSPILKRVLTDHEKVIIQLRFHLDYSFEQIAGFMGTTRSAAQGACERALRKIRAETDNSDTLRM